MTWNSQIVDLFCSSLALFVVLVSWTDLLLVGVLTGILLLLGLSDTEEANDIADGGLTVNDEYHYDNNDNDEDVG